MRGQRGRVIRPEPVRQWRRPPRRLAVWQCGDGPADGETKRRDAHAQPPKTSGPRRVLVVDDDRGIRMVCRFNLVAAGVEVLEATDGEEARDVLGREAVDVLLLDVMMPRRDGWEVAREFAHKVPIVFLTARAEAADRKRAYELGAIGYMVKPFDPIGLADYVETLLKRLDRGEREQLRTEMLRGSG
jgi:DNA-binding response OmpR family regulator